MKQTGNNLLAGGTAYIILKSSTRPDALSDSSGSVLDPIVAIQYRIVLEPYQTAIVDMIFGIADTKDSCNILVEKYQDRHLINRVLELAFTHSQVILRQINAIEADAQLYARLASSIIFANASLRTEPSVILKTSVDNPACGVILYQAIYLSFSCKLKIPQILNW